METIKVLIADDERYTAEALRGILVLDDGHKFLVEIEADHKKVVERVRSWSPHVILLDDRFVDLDVGVSTLLPQIRGEFLNVGIVIITANRGHDISPVARAIPYEIDGFLDKTRDKSIEPEALRKAVIDSYRAYLEREANDH